MQHQASETEDRPADVTRLDMGVTFARHLQSRGAITENALERAIFAHVMQANG